MARAQHDPASGSVMSSKAYCASGRGCAHVVEHAHECPRWLKSRVADAVNTNNTELTFRNTASWMITGWALRIRPQQRVPPQQMPPPPDTGKQFSSQAPHGGITLRWRPDDRGLGHAVGRVRLCPDPADDLGRYLDRDVLGQIGPCQADDDQDATRRHQVPEPRKSQTRIHVVQRSHSADQIETRRLQRSGKHVADDIADATSLRMSLATLDARLIPINADNLRDAPQAQLPSERAVAAPHIHRPLTTRRDDIKHQRLIPRTHPAEYYSDHTATQRDTRPRSTNQQHYDSHSVAPSPW